MRQPADRVSQSCWQSGPLPNPPHRAKTKSKATLDALTTTRDKARADLIEAYERANGRMYIVGDLEKAYAAACEALAAKELATGRQDQD